MSKSAILITNKNLTFRRRNLQTYIQQLNKNYTIMTITSFFVFEVLSILHPIRQVFVDSHGFHEEEHLHVESFLQILLSV